MRIKDPSGIFLFSASQPQYNHICLVPILLVDLMFLCYATWRTTSKRQKKYYIAKILNQIEVHSQPYTTAVCLFSLTLSRAHTFSPIPHAYNVERRFFLLLLHRKNT